MEEEKLNETFLEEFPSAAEMRKYTEQKIFSENFLKEANTILTRMRAAKEPLIAVEDMSDPCLDFLRAKGYQTKVTLLVNGKNYCEISWK